MRTTTADLKPIGPDDLAIMREYRAGEMAVVAEAPQPETTIAELAAIIRNDPLRAAVRWLNLEYRVLEQHREIQALKSRVASFHGSIR